MLKSLRGKILLYFLVFTIVPSVIVGTSAFLISYKVLKDLSISSSKEIIERVNQDLDFILSKAETISIMMSEDLTIQKTLRTEFSGSQERYIKDLEISHDMTNRFKYDIDIFGVYIFGNNQGTYKSNFRTVRKSDLRKELWYTKIIHAGGPLWLAGYNDSLGVISTDTDLISVGVRVIDKGSAEPTGVVLTEIEKKLIKQKMDINIGRDGYLILFNEAGDVICVSGNIDYPRKLEAPLAIDRAIDKYSDEKVSVFMKDTIIFQATVPVNNWKLIGAVPLNQLTEHSLIIAIITAVVLFSVCLCGVFIELGISKKIVSPIENMTQLMGDVESGDLSVRFNVQTGDEIGRLGNSFNNMILRIKSLMDENYLKQRTLRKTELKALQSQINPHFLYNTLDSTIWLLRKGKSDDAIEMIMALTKYFRNSISKGREIISLQDEIEHVRNYLVIQNIRYADQFSFEVFMPEELSKFKTLKVILQPIVENAIYHGVKTNENTGFISIIVLDEDTHITIKISDNGSGMDDEKLFQLNQSNYLSALGSSERKGGYGISNVNERIKLFFGEEYGLSFQSRIGEGTTVRVTIPKYMEEE